MVATHDVSIVKFMGSFVYNSIEKLFRVNIRRVTTNTALILNNKLE